jgi:hypothetical protein
MSAAVVHRPDLLKDTSQTYTPTISFGHSPVSPDSPIRSEIEQIAYILWMRRGCPIGWAETDWFEAQAIVHSLHSK